MKLEEKELPKGWEVKKLGEVCNIQTGKYDANHAKSAGKFRFYTCAFDHMFCDTNRFKGESIILPGNGANVGEVFYFDGEFDAYQRTYVLNNFDKVYSKFLFYHLLCYWRKLNQDKQFGSATNYIRMGNFTDYEVPIPPLPEQQQIVAKIEELFSELENGKKELLIAQAKLKTYRQSLLKWAFEGRLTNKNLKANELPKGWEVKRLGEICKINPKLPNKDQINSELEIQFLPMKLVEEVINKISLTETRTFIEVQKGSYTPFIDEDIIFAKVTPCMENGKIAVVKNLKNGIGFGSSEFHVVRCSESVLNKFIFYFLVRDKFRNEAASEMTGAVGLRRVPKQFIENYSINLPPLPEQQKIVAILESKLTICDAIEETIKTSIKQGEALRQSILKKAFLGTLINKKNLP